MATFQPIVLGDPGFQLTFAATLGLVLYAQPLSECFQRFASRYLPPDTVRKLAGPVGEYFLFTLAAQVTTLPVKVLGRLAILLSVEAGDLLNRPSPETLEAVKGYTLLQTSRNGWIKLSTDGEQMWVEAAR